MRVSLPLRIHPTPFLVPPHSFAIPLRNQFRFTPSQNQNQNQDKNHDHGQGQWKKGVWKSEYPTTKSKDIKEKKDDFEPKIITDMPYSQVSPTQPNPTTINASSSNQIKDHKNNWTYSPFVKYFQQTDSNPFALASAGSGNGKGKAKDDEMEVLVKKKVPAPTIFWTDHLRML